MVSEKYKEEEWKRVSELLLAEEREKRGDPKWMPGNNFFGRWGFSVSVAKRIGKLREV
jgi:hypothetical protein